MHGNISNWKKVEYFYTPICQPIWIHQKFVSVWGLFRIPVASNAIQQIDNEA